MSSSYLEISDLAGDSVLKKTVSFKKLNKIHAYYQFEDEQQNIKKYYFFSTVAFGMTPDIKHDKAAAWIRYQDDSKKVFTVDPSQIVNLDDLNYRYPCVKYQIFTVDTLDWTNGIREHYKSPQVYNNYKRLGSKIINHLTERLTGQKEIYLFDLGCGEGTFLKDVENYFAKKTHALTLFGIDLSSINIENAQKDYKESCVFIHDNVFNIKNKLKELNLEGKPIIITAMGLMTGLVLKNNFVVVELLQLLATIPNVCILGGGEMPVLFNSFTAKKIGFEVKEVDSEGDYFFYIIKKDNELILTQKLAKMHKSKILDLSFMPDPLYFLAHEKFIKACKEKKEEIQIDISYCKFNDDLQKRIKELSLVFPGICWIFNTWNNLDLANAEKFSKENSKINIKMKKVTNEMVTLLPRAIIEDVSFLEEVLSHNQVEETTTASAPKNKHKLNFSGLKSQVEKKLEDVKSSDLQKRLAEYILNHNQFFLKESGKFGYETFFKLRSLTLNNYENVLAEKKFKIGYYALMELSASDEQKVIDKVKAQCVDAIYDCRFFIAGHGGGMKFKSANNLEKVFNINHKVNQDVLEKYSLVPAETTKKNPMLFSLKT